jgi:hypothetical protein
VKFATVTDVLGMNEATHSYERAVFCQLLEPTFEIFDRNETNKTISDKKRNRTRLNNQRNTLDALTRNRLHAAIIKITGRL